MGGRKFTRKSDNGAKFCKLDSIWKALGGYTRDLDSFRKKQDKISALHEVVSRICSQRTDISQKDEKPSKKRQNRTRDGKVCEDEAQSKSSQLREEKNSTNFREQNRSSSSPKHVYFINTITIIRKEEKYREAGSIEPDVTKEDDRDIVFKVEKKVEEGLDCSKPKIKEGDSREIKRNDLDDRTCGETKEVEEAREWMEYEESLDLVDTHDESVYESLLEKMPSCSLSFDFRIKKWDPRNLKIPCIIGRKVILSEDDYRRGCKRAFDLEKGFYIDVDKLDPSYKEETDGINVDGSFDVGALEEEVRNEGGVIKAQRCGKPSSKTGEKVTTGVPLIIEDTKASKGHKKLKTLKSILAKFSTNLRQPLVTSLEGTIMEKEALQATSDQMYLGTIGEDKAHLKLCSVVSTLPTTHPKIPSAVILHSEFASRDEASAIIITGANLEQSKLNDSLLQQGNEKGSKDQSSPLPSKLGLIIFKSF
ncbi:hypothetical protein Tco_1266366 [Tanacetum coccineum]